MRETRYALKPHNELSNKILLKPVCLHLAAEVGVCLLGCGVVGQELDIGAQFFHNLISLSTWD